MIKSIYRISFVLVIALLVSSFASAQVGQRDAARCVGLELTSVENPDGWHQEKFAAYETSDIYFNYLFPEKMEGEYLISLRIYTPNGHLYRQMDHPVILGGRAVEGGRKVAGYPYPVKVLTTNRTVMDERSYERARANFPVAGTSIMTSSLYGTWRVEILVDGQLQSCEKEIKFRIVE